jgi:hypothetical protein
MKVLLSAAAFLLGCTTTAVIASADTTNNAGSLTTTITSPVDRMTMTLTNNDNNLGGCPPKFHNTGLYEAGDRVMMLHSNSIVVECTSWPNSLFCSQIGFEPSLTSVNNNWKHAWQVVGYCTPSAIASTLDGCPAGAGEWVYGNHNNYQENDQVSVARTTTGTTLPNQQVHSLYTCKPWPYSSFCAMFSPIDINGMEVWRRLQSDFCSQLKPNQ